MDLLFNKINQHYVPRFWQRRFADMKDRVYGRYGDRSDPNQNPRKKGSARVIGVAETMAQNCTYTVLDKHYRPYDVLENLLSDAEGKIRHTEDLILDPQTVVTPELRATFCWGMALAACRLPHVMSRARRRRIDLAFAYCDVGNLDRAAFEAKLATFGQIINDAEYEELKARPREGLLQTAEGLSKLSPQDPTFPEQDALYGVHMLAEIFNQMDIVILETAGIPFFILGDTPIPDYDLVSGFTVPLSKTVAARFSPSAASPAFSRRAATQVEAQEINQEQYNNSATHAIGPDPVYLDSL